MNRTSCEKSKSEWISMWEARLAICNACPKYLKPVCKVCGCFMPIKAIIPRLECPDNPPRWTKSHIPSSSTD